VRDGDTLYADKNGNGDLTDAGEKVAAEADGLFLTFHVGTIRRGQLEHRNLTVRASKLSLYGADYTDHPVAKAALTKDKNVCLMMVNAEVAVPGLTGGGDDGRLLVSARFDASGPLLFAKDPPRAPVLHFGGPLHLGSESNRPTLYR